MTCTVLGFKIWHWADTAFFFGWEKNDPKLVSCLYHMQQVGNSVQEGLFCIQEHFKHIRIVCPHFTTMSSTKQWKTCISYNTGAYNTEVLCFPQKRKKRMFVVPSRGKVRYCMLIKNDLNLITSGLLSAWWPLMMMIQANTAVF